MVKGNKRTKITEKRVKKALHTARDPEIEMEALGNIATEVFQETEVKAQGRVPGQKIGGNKTPWTEADMNERFEIVSFVPDETIPITWNGIRYQCFAGIEMHVPEPIKERWDFYKKNKTKSGQPPKGSDLVVDLGAGSLS